VVGPLRPVHGNKQKQAPRRIDLWGAGDGCERVCEALKSLADPDKPKQTRKSKSDAVRTIASASDQEFKAALAERTTKNGINSIVSALPTEALNELHERGRRNFERKLLKKPHKNKPWRSVFDPRENQRIRPQRTRIALGSRPFFPAHNA
jgi:hypothetical protein